MIASFQKETLNMVTFYSEDATYQRMECCSNYIHPRDGDFVAMWQERPVLLPQIYYHCTDTPVRLHIIKVCVLSALVSNLHV